MFIKRLLLPLCIAALFAACASDSSTFEPDPNRAPLGKRDGFGSCEGHCGEKSDGSCYCDDACSYYGDCCADKVEVCDAPQETLCGGFLGATCDDDEYCHFSEQAFCGFADASGVCQPRPEACIEIFAPVCGCDSQTYPNSCYAKAAGTSVQHDGACEPQPQFCGGFGGIQCPDGFECQDDPNDDCDPANGGADCGGICVESEECEPVACELACANGFKTDENGCEICECAEVQCLPVFCTLFCEDGFKQDENGCDICECVEPEPEPAASCEGSCGGQSPDGCWCDDLCSQYGDCCGDVDEQCSADERSPASGQCVKNSNDECETDADCTAGGCGGELCFNPSVSSGISTCECTAPQQVDGCGCVNGSCTWYNE